MIGEAAQRAGIATAQLPAVGELEHAADVILALHIQIGHLIDTTAEVAAMLHMEMPAANDAGKLDILRQHIVTVSSIADSEFLSSLAKAGLLAIHLAIEKGGPQSLDQIDHDGIKLVAHAFQSADAAGMIEV